MSEHSTVEALISEVEVRLSLYKENFKGLTWRDKVILLVNVSGSIKKLGKSTNPDAAKVGAHERIRLYMLDNIGVAIAAAELEVVSGISEYGRRVRELRVQDGYKILTGYSNDPETGIELKPKEYLLVDSEPDNTAAKRWHVANRIRKEVKGGSKGRILRYIMANVGQVVTNEELAYVAKAKEFGRRVRELRTEEGYSVATRITGRPDLKIGEYVLESAERRSEPHDRNIPFEIQRQVYERDQSTCRLDGWNRQKWSRSDPRILELHHIKEHVAGGQNIPENLIVLCSKCHDDIHAGRRQLPPHIME